MTIQESNQEPKRERQSIDILAERIASSVLSGNEQPDVEMKNHITLSDNYGISEFIKDIQSMANSPIVEEKLYVIGADEENRRFLSVSNLDEFDEEKIRQLLDKYLTPQITFKKYNFPINKEDLSVGYYVVIGIPKIQNPPYIIIKNLTYIDENGKNKPCLREGDCWVRSGGNIGSTGRRLSLREDYDRMYREFIEINTEKRLNARSKVIMEEKNLKDNIVETNGLVHIREEIIYEDTDKFIKTIETWMLNDRSNYIDFLIKKISILVKREWGKTQHKEGIKLEEIEELTYNLKYNIFIPCLSKLFHMCSIFIQYDRYIDMFEKICKSIYEINLLSKDFPEYGVSRIPNRKYPTEHLSWTLLAFETAIIVESLGGLCVELKNYKFLNKLMSNSICLDFDENRYKMKEKVIIFNRFYSDYGEPDYQKQGFTEYVNRRALNELEIGRYVSRTDDFLNYLCLYECILEMNSYGLIKLVSDDHKWSYCPDFYRYNQDRIYSFIYEAITRRHDAEFYNNLLFNQIKITENFNFEKFLVMYLQYLPWYRSNQGYGRYGGWWSNKWSDDIQKFIDDWLVKGPELKNFKLGKENNQ